MILFKSRFVIQRVDMRRTSAHAEKDDAFRFGLEVRLAWRQRRCFVFLSRLRRRQAGERKKSKTRRETSQSISARDWIHDVLTKWRFHFPHPLVRREVELRYSIELNSVVQSKAWQNAVNLKLLVRSEVLTSFMKSAARSRSEPFGLRPSVSR